MDERKWYLRTQDETFGPETRDTLVSWAKMGRILPGQEVSDDNVIWTKVEDAPFLDMRFSIDIGDGNPRGPFNRAAADALIASGRLPAAAKVVEIREPFPVEEETVEEAVENAPKIEQQDLFEQPAESAPEPEPAPAVEDPAPAAEEPVAEESIAEEPNVKVVEKVVEVPVEKIVEKEVRVEIPVEKIVEKIVTVVDDTRVKELEGMLEEERGRVAAIQAKFDESAKLASDQRSEIARLEGEVKNGGEREKSLEERRADAERRFEQAVRDATDREAKLNEQITALENELRRLPQAASEVADIQAAMYSLMTREASEIEKLLAVEKDEFEAFRKRCEERADRLRERRRDILKRSGDSIEAMTKKSLVERPEDPRTAQLRRELEEFRRLDEKKTLDAMARIRDLESQLKDRETEGKRAVEGLKDVTELRRENQALREQLQIRERELVVERERAETVRQREAASHQAMVARLKTLESPSIGTAASISTNQSREAKLVKLPSWMRFGGK